MLRIKKQKTAFPKERKTTAISYLIPIGHLWKHIETSNIRENPELWVKGDFS